MGIRLDSSVISGTLARGAGIVLIAAVGQSCKSRCTERPARFAAFVDAHRDTQRRREQPCPQLAVVLLVDQQKLQLGDAEVPVMPASLDGLRVETTLQGHRVEVVYQVQDPGHGVQAVQLNGKVLAFARATNPYRLGAARVPSDGLLQLLTAGNNVLKISVDPNARGGHLRRSPAHRLSCNAT